MAPWPVVQAINDRRRPLTALAIVVAIVAILFGYRRDLVGGIRYTFCQYDDEFVSSLRNDLKDVDEKLHQCRNHDIEMRSEIANAESNAKKLLDKCTAKRNADIEKLSDEKTECMVDKHEKIIKLERECHDDLSKRKKEESEEASRMNRENLLERNKIEKELQQCKINYTDKMTKLEEKKAKWLHDKEKEYMDSVNEIKERCEADTDICLLERDQCRNKNSNEKNWYYAYGILTVLAIRAFLFCCGCLTGHGGRHTPQRSLTG